jgi:hypothetical protein
MRTSILYKNLNSQEHKRKYLSTRNQEADLPGHLSHDVDSQQPVVDSYHFRREINVINAASALISGTAPSHRVRMSWNQHFDGRESDNLRSLKIIISPPARFFIRPSIVISPQQ